MARTSPTWNSKEPCELGASLLLKRGPLPWVYEERRDTLPAEGRPKELTREPADETLESDLPVPCSAAARRFPARQGVPAGR